MIRVSIFISTMRFYQIGALEAQWLLNAPASHYKLLSNGRIVLPFQL